MTLAVTKKDSRIVKIEFKPKRYRNVAFLIPTYNNAPILQRCLGYILRLDPQPRHIVILENNSQDETFDVIKKLKEYRPDLHFMSFCFVKDAVKRLGNAYATIGTVRQMLLEKARKLDVDYAIFIDDDVFLGDIDFIDRITRWGVDLCGGPYLRSYPNGTFLASKWFNLGKDAKKFPYTLRKHAKGFQKVAMTSGGCLCISRKLLMDIRVNFMPILNPQKYGDTSEDYGYCAKARWLGYPCYLDATLRVGHYLKDQNYKPWVVDSKTFKGRKVEKYLPFEYGHEDVLIEARTDKEAIRRLLEKGT